MSLRAPLLLTVLLAALAWGGVVPNAFAEDGPTGVWPLQPQPEVVAGFDPPDSPYGAGHRGVDLLGTVGQPVRTAMAGTVTYAGMLAGRGVVVVDHGATRTTYEPVAATVHVGARVAAGATIGSLELAGSHCFPRACLHWGWIRNSDDVYLDPLLLVGAGPVRLLPLWRDEPFETARPSPPQEPPFETARPSPPQEPPVGSPTASTRLRSAYVGWQPLLAGW